MPYADLERTYLTLCASYEHSLEEDVFVLVKFELSYCLLNRQDIACEHVFPILLTQKNLLLMGESRKST